MNLELTFDLMPVFGVILVLVNRYLWKFRDWYEQLASDKKQTANAAILGIITLVTVLLSALDVVDVYGGSTWQSWVAPPIVDWVIALLTNSSTYKATNFILTENPHSN